MRQEKGKRPARRAAAAAGAVRIRRIGRLPFAAGAVLLGVAAVLATLLAAKHFGGTLPGCGPQSGCEGLEKTAWGVLPGLRWPTSFAGLAYFLALLAGWLAAARDVPERIRWIVRAGCAVSVLYVAVMIGLRKFCPYCAGTHVANLAFLGVMETSMRRARPAGASGGPRMDRRRLMRILSVAAGVFALASVALGVANARHEKEALAQAESDRRASTAKILEPSKPSAPDRLIDRWGTAGFTGRYRLGPEACAIRIVMFTDYQCPDCKRIDGEIDQIMAGRSDVSLSVKQFPMCQDAEPGVPCNRYAPGNMHPNACWAARAAEAAGILYGDDGFWKMHRWLFQHAGSFSDAELKEGLAQLGFDPNAFPPVMNSPETLKRVRDDVEEGIALGLFSTPMIFVNGVEFKGWQTPGALKKTIDEVTAKNPPAEKATVDRPPLAEQKFLDDWREQPPRVMPYSARSWSMGADPAHPPKGTPIVYVLVFGDYQESFTAEMDGAIRDFVKSHPQVRYTFRHYPVNTDCNPTLPANVPAGSLHPLACRTAKAAEAAGTIGGPTAFWAMHAWLMANQKTVSDETIRAEARAIGLDEGKFAAAMDSPQVAAAITQDAQAGKQLGLSFVPMVFVNAKWVPRMSREDENIVIQILKEITAKK